MVMLDFACHRYSVDEIASWRILIMEFERIR